jgi:4-amino-4-deoxy-L-arabinose transferase-like glycosyltransferase
MGLAVALRLPALGTIPPEVHGDEASIGLDARALLADGFHHVFGLGFAGLPELGYAPVALSLRLFGNGLWALRLPSVIEGVASVALLYLVTRRLFGTRPAVLAAFVLAVQQAHIHFSRTGFHYMQAVPATLLVVFFAIRALDTRRNLDFLLLGLSLALCELVYYAARGAVAIVAPYVVYRLLRDRAAVRRLALGLLWTLVGLSVALAPAAVATVESGQPLLGSRVQDVWLFTDEHLTHERQAYGVSSALGVVGIQARQTLSAVNSFGETSLQWGRARKPLLDVWTAALFVPGLAYALFRVRKPEFLLLLCWLLVPLLAATFTIDAPFVTRLVPLLPVLAVFPALVVDAGWRATERLGGVRGGLAFGAAVVALGALVSWANYREYFHEYVRTVRVAGPPTVAAGYVNRLGHDYRVYLVNGNWELRNEAFRFLAPGVDGQDLGGDPPLPPPDIASARHAVFIVDAGAPGRDAALARLTELYPSAHQEEHVDARGAPLFVSVEVARP